VAALAAEFDRSGGQVVTWTLVIAHIGGASPTLEKMSVDVFASLIQVE
jgi:hypothetical protein